MSCRLGETAEQRSRAADRGRDDKLAVNIGLEILKLVPGRISLKLMRVFPMTPKRQLRKQNADQTLQRCWY